MDSPSPASSSARRSPDIERIVKLAKDEQILIKVPESCNGSIEFTLLDGAADLFGTKLKEGQHYSYGSGSTFSILAGSGGDGCTLSFTKGQRFILKTVDATTETTDKILRNVATLAEDLRCVCVSEYAESEHKMGPVIILAGPVDTGKSTACISLINYAVQCGRQPFYVDLDLGQGKLSLPGTFGAVVADKAIGISGNFGDLKKHAINYFVGSKSPGDCLAQHNLIASAFAKAIKDKMKENPEVNCSGMIINSCGWVEGTGYKILRHIIEAFEADQVLVMGEEPPNLRRKLREDFSETNILPIPTSELITEKTRSFRIDARAERVYNYFYAAGVQDELKSSKSNSFEVQLSNVKIFKLSQTKYASESSILCPVVPSRALLNQLLGVSQCATATADENPLNMLSLSGYVCAMKINQVRGTLTLVAPPSQPVFKQAVLLLSEIPLIERR